MDDPFEPFGTPKKIPSTSRTDPFAIPPPAANNIKKPIEQNITGMDVSPPF